MTRRPAGLRLAVPTALVALAIVTSAPAARAAEDPPEPAKESAEPAKEPAEPAKEPAEPAKEPAEPTKEPAEPTKEPKEPPGSQPAQGGGGILGETKLWGAAYYQAVAADALTLQSNTWGVAQETDLSLNLRSSAGLEFLSDFIIPVSLDLQNLALSAIPQQLAVRLNLSDSLTLVAGKQRLNWGTAKIFSAIDTLEPRANPLDVRSILPGVAGVKAVFIPSEWLSFSVIGLPASELRYSGGAARVDFVQDDLGLDLGLGAVKYTYLDYGVSGTSAAKLDRVALMSDGAWSMGSLVLYEEIQLRWGREISYQFPTMAASNDFGGRDQAVFRGVGGMTLQIDFGLKRPALLVAEYLYNGDGLSAGESRTFVGDYTAWLDSSAPAAARVPLSFLGIGGFRRHYFSAALQNVALTRYLLLGGSGIVGLDSGFTRFGLSLEWDPTQQTSIALRYEYYHAFADSADQPTELVLIPFRHRVALVFTTSF